MKDRAAKIGIASAIALGCLLGFPSIAQAAQIPGGFYKAPWESCVYQVSSPADGSATSYVSAARWKALGYPTVTTSTEFVRQKAFFYKNSTSPH